MLLPVFSTSVSLSQGQYLLNKYDTGLWYIFVAVYGISKFQ